MPVCSSSAFEQNDAKGTQLDDFERITFLP